MDRLLRDFEKRVLKEIKDSHLIRGELSITTRERLQKIVDEFSERRENE
jgi:hypothetical protein